MTAQPNDRAVERLTVQVCFCAGVNHDPDQRLDCAYAETLVEQVIAAIRDALTRGGDDADAIAQAIGLGRQERPSEGNYAGMTTGPGVAEVRVFGRYTIQRRYVSEWRGVQP